MAGGVRDTRGRWRAGQSGNPGGRYPGALALRQAAAQHAIEALAVLYTIMRDARAPAAQRRQAARDLLRLAVGRDVPLREAAELLALAGLTALPPPAGWMPPVAPARQSAAVPAGGVVPLPAVRRPVFVGPR